MSTTSSLPLLPRPATLPRIHSLLMHTPQPSPYVLTRDTACREGCPHYGHPAAPHSHYTQEERPSPAWEPNRIWRALFRIYGDGGR